MNAEQTIKLLEAGFTKEEILSMSGEESAPKESTEAVSGEQNATTQTHDSAVDPIADVMKSLQLEVSKLGETVKAMQETNLKNASTGSPTTGDPIKETIDGFLKEL